MRSLLHVPEGDNPTSPGLGPHAARLLHTSSLLALGTLDNEGRPWTTLIGGGQGLARSLGQSIIGVKTLVDREYDPVLDILMGKRQNGEVCEVGEGGRLISALGIHLATRDRVKLWGKMIAGAFSQPEIKNDVGRNAGAEVQLVLTIQQSLGNCPKYLNMKQIIPFKPSPILSAESLPLSPSTIKMLSQADMFFMSSHYEDRLGTNHRGGPPGFVRVAQNDDRGTVLIYPEYSGNRLYQSLGNICANPKAGLVFPDFDTGDVLYVTGVTEIIHGRDAAAVLPRSNLVVRITITAARFVEQGLSFRGEIGERSPYNPPIRYLPTERILPNAQIANSKAVYASLVARELLTHSIARLRFSISDPVTAGRWKPGQYVALAFEDELATGYSHMRDDDPKSLNDDYIRTFTVSSSPVDNIQRDGFEITIRNVGVVTDFLCQQYIRAGLEVPLKGFGGTFTIEQGPDDIISFVAGGIGITPLLSQLHDLDLKRVQLLWTISAHDAGLVLDTLRRCPSLAPSTRIFISRLGELSPIHGSNIIGEIEKSGSWVGKRRIMASDVEEDRGLRSTWYLCTGMALRRSLLEWLSGRRTVYEDFDY